MKPLLSAAGSVLFDSFGVMVFAALMALKVDIIVATVVGTILSVGVVAWPLWRRRPVEALQWISLALVLVGAAATLLTHDPRFIMAKPTVIYAVVAAVMLKRGWMLRYLPPIAVGRVGDVMIAFGYVWAGLMALTGVLNAVVAVMWPHWWPGFIAVFPLATKAALFVIQNVAIRVVARRRRTMQENTVAIA